MRHIAKYNRIVLVAVFVIALASTIVALRGGMPNLAGYVGRVTALWKPAMPDLSTMEPGPVRSILCSTGDFIGRQGFNKPGSDAVLYEAMAYYATSEDASARRPFVVVLFETDVLMELTRIYADFDRDGRVDFDGMPGAPELGDGPCDVFSRLSGAPANAPVIVPAKKKIIL